MEKPVSDRLILAVNDPWHDSAYVVWRSGEIRHVEIERYTRRKYERLAPLPAIAFLEPDLLEQADLLLVGEGSNWTPLVRRVLANPGLDLASALGPLIARAAPDLPDPVDPEDVRRRLQGLLTRIASGNLPVRFYNHHFTHAVNGFLSSPFEEALSVSLDGGGEQWNEGKVSLVHGSAYAFSRHGEIADAPLEIVDSWSPGFAWDRACAALGMTAHEAGTVMAMAAYGERQWLIERIVRSDALWSLPPHQSPLWRRALWRIMRRTLRSLTHAESGRFALGRALQEETERRIRAFLAPHLQGRTSVDLCLSGGTFLNCVAAYKIHAWFPQVREIFIGPVPYDAGLCIGMMQDYLHEQGLEPHGQGRAAFAFPPAYGEAEVKAALAQASLDPQAGVELARIAAMLGEGRIVAIFQGGSESGRRALGNRSILADPRAAANRERLNATIKRRQWYRPFAPMILAEEAANWFDLPERFSSPYMGFAAPFRAGMGEQVPAVLHADGTARLQTVHRELTPLTHALLSEWFARSGVPILLNTSFNENEPIVETPAHAIDTFLRSGLDALYFADHGLLVERNSGGAQPR